MRGIKEGASHGGAAPAADAAPAATAAPAAAAACTAAAAPDDAAAPAAATAPAAAAAPATEPDLGERAAHGPSLCAAALLHAEDGDGLVAAVRDDDVPPGLVRACRATMKRRYE